MTILATVNFGKKQITQSWKFLEGDPSPVLEVFSLEDGRSIMINLERRFVKDIQGPAEKTYLGSLHISDCIIVPSNPPHQV
jgi:hypothetical protein